MDVFISYKQEEREAAQIIASAFHDLKLSVWFDTKLRAGGSFDEEIAGALNAAAAVLVCWTPAAIQSEWVRGEATQGLQSNRLAACYLQPTALIPPFNLVHAENLSAWAGQQDDPGWVKLLERIGELVGRPGLSTYHHVMRSGAALGELKAWANANGADPLVDSVWARIAVIEGEGSSERLAREKLEARIAGEKRRALAERSRRLARERGLRDPVRERRRFQLLVGSVIAFAVLTVGAMAYFVDAQGRERALQENVVTLADARAFLRGNAWHPIAARAREKFARLDTAAWEGAQRNGSLAALESYLEQARQAPAGAYAAEAETAAAAARQVQQVQNVLNRLLIYRGPIDGAMNDETGLAIETFRYRAQLPVSREIDAALLAQLDAALRVWILPPLEDLRALTLDPPTEADFIRLASEYGVEAAMLHAVVDVEGAAVAFTPEGRPIILFEPHIFSRLTGRAYDETNPNVSYRVWDARRYPRTQEDRWAQLAEAYALDPQNALAAASYGRVQLMGFNFASFGFETPGEYVRFMSQSETNQVEAMLRFARVNGIVDELQRKDFEGFAARYNGPGGAARYGALLREAYERRRLALAQHYGLPLPEEASPQREAVPEAP